MTHGAPVWPDAAPLSRHPSRRLPALLRYLERLDAFAAGLTVADIAETNLVTRAIDTPTPDIVADRELGRFDVVPIVAGDEVVGVVERTSDHYGLANDAMEVITSRISIDAATPIDGVVARLLRGQPTYRLVMDDEAVTGIVTRADLLKPPARLAGAMLLARLEAACEAAIRARYGDGEEWTWTLPGQGKDHLIYQEEDREPLGLDADPLATQELWMLLEVAFRTLRVPDDERRAFKAIPERLGPMVTGNVLDNVEQQAAIAEAVDAAHDLRDRLDSFIRRNR